MKLEAMSDIYPEPSSSVKIPVNYDYIRNLIGKNYSEEKINKILHCVSIDIENGNFLIPKWRKDITHLADIAEEVARLDGYDAIESTVPRINL